MVKGLFVLVVAAVAFVVYALIDCLFTERFRFRALNKPVWAIIIIVLPVVGGALWFLMGRRSRTARRTIGPDDDPDFLGRPPRPVSDTDRETLDEEIRRIEKHLADQDDEGPGAGTGKPGPK